MLYALVTRNGNTYKATYLGMTEETVRTLIEDLDGTVQFVTQAEYEAA